MKRRWQFLSLIYFCAAFSHAQTSLPASYTIRPSYAPGTTLSLALESRIEDARDNSSGEQIYRAPVTLRVLRNSTAGTLLEWKAGKGSLENVKQTTDPLVNMAEQIITALGLIVQLDPAGRYIGLQNEAALRARVETFAKLLIPQATAKIKGTVARQQAVAVMTAALTPETLLSAARKELDLYFGISGLQLEPGRVIRKKSALLNPFAPAGSLNGEMEIRSAEIDPTNRKLLVEFHQQYDPGKTFQMSAGSSAAEETSKITLDEAGQFVLDSATWQVREVRHTRTIRRNKEAVRTETTVITLQ